MRQGETPIGSSVVAVYVVVHGTEEVVSRARGMLAHQTPEDVDLYKPAAT